MKTLIIALLLSVSALAYAAPLNPPIQTVGVYVSQPGHVKEDFVREVAVTLNRWTLATGVEACGYIAAKTTPAGTQYGIELGTIGSQLTCHLNAGMIPDGFLRTNETLHSHPRADSLGRIAVNAATRRINDLPQSLRYVRVGVKQFSEEDYAEGPGYVVIAGHHLLYQNGWGQRRDLGAI